MNMHNAHTPRPAQGAIRWTDRRFNGLLMAGLIFAAWACADDGEGCGGCDDGCDLLSCDDDGTGPTAPAYIFPEDGPRITNGLQVHVTQRGLDFIADNLTPLLGDLLGEGGLSFCLEPLGFELPGMGEIEICGGGDVCDDGTDGCQLTFEIGDVELTPVSPDRLQVELGVTDLNETIGIGGAADCLLTLSAARLPIRAAVDFTIDPVTGRTHAALPSDAIDFDLDTLSIAVTGEDSLCGIAASAAPLLLGVFAGELTGPIDDLVGDALCRPCSGEVPCPDGASCLGNICVDPVTDTCLGMDLGLEDQFDLGALIGDISPGLEASLGYMVWLAELARTVDTGPGYGLDLGGEIGFHAEPSLCVPHAEPPSIEQPPLASELFRSLSPVGNPFAVGIGVHRNALDLALWAAYRSGVLCIGLGSDTIDQLSSGTLAILVPSLNDLTEGENRAMQIRLQPQEPPRIEIGSGTRTLDDGTEVGAPLLLLTFENLDLDFYLFAWQRFTRVFTLNIDLRLPIDIGYTETGGIQILLGDVGDAITRIQPTNAYLLAAADAQGLADALPSLLGLFLPALTEALEDPIELPELLGFQLTLGPGAITAIEDGEMLGIFADLQPAMAGIQALQSAPVPVLTHQNVTPGDARRAEQLRREGAPHQAIVQALTPRIDLGIDAHFRDSSRKLEASYRLDRGLWSTWQPTATFAIEEARLLGEGVRTIDLRVRYADEPSNVSPRTVALAVVQDFTPPSIDLELQGDLLHVRVSDNLTPAENLTVRASIDGGNWIELDAPNATLDARMLDGARAVVVDAFDDAGLRQRAEKRLDRGDDAAPATRQRGGCAAASPGTGGGWLTLLLLGGLLVLRRRRLGILLAAGFFAAACGGSDSSPPVDTGSETDPPPAACEENDDCEGMAICTDGTCEAVQCFADDDCADVCRFGGACAGTDCACESPDGGCPSGTWFCATTGACQDIPDPCAELECAAGTTPVLRAYPDVDLDSCQVNDPGLCECLAADPLALGNFGPSIAAASSPDGSTRVVAARNDTYRDLMVGVLRGDGTIAWTSVDGVPEDGEVTGDPAGPRGGIAGQGADAGRDVRIARGEDGNFWITSRQRVNAGESLLRLTRATVTGGSVSASTLTLDDVGVAGAWTAPVPTADGVTVVHTRPRVAEEPETLNGDGDGRTRYFSEIWMTTSDGSQAGESTMLDRVETEAPCGGRCPFANQRCVLDSNICEAPEPARRCSDPDCGDNQACYSGDDGFECRNVAPEPTFAELPPTAGLFLHAAMTDDGVLHVVHHDRARGQLRYLTVDEEGAVADASILDGPTEDLAAQAGRFATIHVGAAGAFVAYMDAALGELRAVDLASGTITTVDDGLRVAGEGVAQHRVGASVRAVEHGGTSWLFYQDTTDHTVWAAARLEDGSWDEPVFVDFGAATDALSALGFGLGVWADGAGVDVVSWRYRRRAQPTVASVIVTPFADSTGENGNGENGNGENGNGENGNGENGNGNGD